MRHLKPADYTVSTWSGGKTVQLAIGPEGALYSDRNFLWRISSATVELESSEFTALPDYERLIAPIRGEMALSHNGGKEVLLRPYEVHRFDGADLTLSRGKCTDFNLMLRKGSVTGEMRAVFPGPQGKQRITPDMLGDVTLLYLAEGSAVIRRGGDKLELLREEAVLLESRDCTKENVPGEEALELTFPEGQGGAIMMAAVRKARE
ncbi:MAG: HutD family protein [Stomatobaculum sp.]|nr:HutD family protein [Stomatobaculum sp.]